MADVTNIGSGVTIARVEVRTVRVRIHTFVSIAPIVVLLGCLLKWLT